MEQPTILYEDSELLVVNKPAGWVVHEGAGREEETLVDWFVKNYPEATHEQWPDSQRIGIVHRLDKDTSGAIVLAKRSQILFALQEQFKNRSVKKEYVAFVYGVPKTATGTITTYIGRHPRRRQEQAVLAIAPGGAIRREAVTHYTVEKSIEHKDTPWAIVRFFPETGRMHQLRVHAKYIGHPVLGDPIYSIKPAKRMSKRLNLRRQLLHAEKIQFTHPISGRSITVTAPLPADMQQLLSSLSH